MSQRPFHCAGREIPPEDDRISLHAHSKPSLNFALVAHSLDESSLPVRQAGRRPLAENSLQPPLRTATPDLTVGLAVFARSLRPAVFQAG
jgi:hypothetical protein